MERGVIRNEEVARILRDFRSLKFERGITPTDIDCFLEFGGNVYIIVETKFKSNVLSGGQRMALERLVDVIGLTKKSLLIIAKHDIEPHSGEKIDVGNCVVVEYRTNRKWFVAQKVFTVRFLIDKFREHTE